MADQTVVRAPRALVRKIDEYGRRVARETGVEVTRTAAAHALLRLGLRAVTPRRFRDQHGKHVRAHLAMLRTEKKK